MYIYNDGKILNDDCIQPLKSITVDAGRRRRITVDLESVHTQSQGVSMITLRNEGRRGMRVDGCAVIKDLSGTHTTENSKQSTQDMIMTAILIVCPLMKIDVSIH